MKFASFVLLLVLLLGFAVEAQTTTYAVPKKVPLERQARLAFPQYFGHGQRYPALIPEQFFPVGWSKDGKFAYYVEPVDEACGCYYADLVIQDMRTDKVLWEFKYSQDEQRNNETNKMPPEDNIQKLWKKNQKLFSDKLREHGIVASTSALLGKTFTAAGRSYSAKAAVKTGKNPDYDEPRINNYSITLSAPKLGSKKLFTSEDHTKDEYWFMLNAGIIGVLKSPFEDRIAVIVMEAMRGYEGPPNPGELRIVGADLMSGFVKK
jgi:hypothetical protein